MEHSTGSNSTVYNGSYVNDGGYVMPISTMVVDQSNGNQGSSSFGGESENMLGVSDPYSGGRSVYYPTGVVKDNGNYDQNGWMARSSSNNVGAPLFTVWNDA